MEQDTRPTRTRTALGIVATGALAWIGGGFYYGAGLFEQSMVGLVLIAVGLGGAAWALGDAPRVAAGGFAVALVGILLFLGPSIGRFDRLARVASHLFAVALVLMGAAMLLSARRQATAFRVGAAVAVLATLLWIAADMEELAWQPGNVLVGIGSAWAGLGRNMG